ncbi:hypothetical protein KUTeg_012717 [Tegillarca granosa]|uniref:SGNH hydrolase-type esterase domain-containing protein n=1 Tax=Tegillarca granosa TaxID=220873 RepID=A0ABQ9F0D7_TEGGR|nr:hypothetical protein KUTeg_012717 [Tegillarca granosa]
MFRHLQHKHMHIYHALSCNTMVIYAAKTGEIPSEISSRDDRTGGNDISTDSNAQQIAEDIKQLAKDEDILVWQLRRFPSKNHFLDGVHLNPAGNKKFVASVAAGLGHYTIHVQYSINNKRKLLLHIISIENEDKVLIAGHSQAKYFSHHLKRTDVDVVSFSGFRIEQMWEKIHTMVPFYTMIVLHIGSNNLWNDSVSKVLRQYPNLVQNIWTVNATCRVVISGLLPRDQNRFPGKAKSVKFLSMVNRKALAVNKKLHLISQSYQRLSYVGHPDFMVNGQL